MTATGIARHERTFVGYFAHTSRRGQAGAGNRRAARGLASGGRWRRFRVML